MRNKGFGLAVVGWLLYTASFLLPFVAVHGSLRGWQNAILRLEVIMWFRPSEPGGYLFSLVYLIWNGLMLLTPVSIFSRRAALHKVLPHLMLVATVSILLPFGAALISGDISLFEAGYYLYFTSYCMVTWGLYHRRGSRLSTTGELPSRLTTGSS